MKKSGVDVVNDRWFPNKTVVAIIIFAIITASSVVFAYTRLQAKDASIESKVELLKVEINGKLDSILSKIKANKCEQ